MKTPRKSITATVVRTELIGGGTTYVVYMRVADKRYRPIAAGTYATEIHHNGSRYYGVADFFRTPQLDGLPAFSDIRWDSFRRLHRAVKRLELRIARRAFSELSNLSSLPALWASWTFPSAEKEVTVSVNARYMA